MMKVRNIERAVITVLIMAFVLWATRSWSYSSALIVGIMVFSASWIVLSAVLGLGWLEDGDDERW
jgi:hypothetical protein